MPTELERVVLVFEAQSRNMERSLKRIEQRVDGTMRRAQRSTQAFDAAMGRAARAVGALAASFASIQAVRGAQRLIDSATEIENSLKVAGLAGEELESVYQSLFASAQKNAAPLQTLAQLYGRIAIVQNELGVSQQELLTFTDNVSTALRVQGGSVQQASGALLQLSQALGSGTVRAEEFNSILDGALPILQAAAAGLEEAGGSVSRLRQLVVDGKVSSEAFFRAFEAGSVILEEKVAAAEFTTSQGFTRLYNVLINTAREFNKATGVSEALGRRLDALAGQLEGFGAVIQRIADGPVGSFISKIGAADEAARGLIGTLGRLSLNDEILGAVGNFLAPERELTEDAIQEFARRQGLGSGAAPKTNRPRRAPKIDTVSTEDFSPPASSRGGGSGGSSRRSEAAREADRQREAIQGVIASLQFEQAQLGRTDEQQRIYNELKRAGISANSEQGQKIAGLVQQIEAEEAAMRQAAATQQFFNDLAMDGFQSLASAIDTGNEALDRFLGKLIDVAAQALILGQGPLAGLFGGGLFGGFGGGFAPNTTFGAFLGVPGLATGTNNWRGGVAMVGEEGPELLNLPRGSQVVPNKDLSGIGGGYNVPISINLDATGADDGAALRIEQSLRQLQSSLPGIVVRTVKDAQKRRVLN